ncbi:hypothetical protein DFR33_11528 [Bradymonas sediminis]|uniref:Uncharacterized protein n=2 Tax=Bradymonas sediminis TaxID=1548548 RepID=A0A2Z4FM46_9DELT|nr:hypothetical protein DN745_11395 [Bradymonas sediminis]TDP62012.1 hypothetical protein DFR33_11528 [Bradymonas sediminis]
MEHLNAPVDIVYLLDFIACIKEQSMTSPLRSCILLLVMFSFLGASFGCATSAAKPASTPAEAPRTEQRDALEPALAIFERYASYMPDDTALIVLVRTDLAARFAEETFYSPDEAVSQKRLDATRADFQRLLLTRLGIDPLSADFVMVVSSPEHDFLILDGEITTEFGTQKSIESQGYQARYINEDPEMPDDGFWVAALPEDDAVAVFDTPASFEAFAKNATTASSGLHNSALAPLYRELFSNTKTAPFSGAILFDAASKEEFASEHSVTLPDALAFHLGKELRVELRGDEQTLKGVHESVEKLRQEARETAAESYHSRCNDEPFEASVSISAYHLLRHYDDQLIVTPPAESLVYELPLPRHFLAFTIATSGIAGAVFFNHLDRLSEDAEQALLDQHRAEEPTGEEPPPTGESSDGAPADADQP